MESNIGEKMQFSSVAGINKCAAGFECHCFDSFSGAFNQNQYQNYNQVYWPSVNEGKEFGAGNERINE